MFLGTILIAGGAVLIAIFGIVPEPTRSLEDLLILFRRPAFVAYFSLLGAAVFICLIAVSFCATCIPINHIHKDFLLSVTRHRILLTPDFSFTSYDAPIRTRTHDFNNPSGNGAASFPRCGCHREYAASPRPEASFRKPFFYSCTA